MKDLKHYFTSPAGSDNEVVNENNDLISRKRKIRSVSNNSECMPASQVGIKKKKKKKNRVDECDDEQLSDTPKQQKKRKKTMEENTLKKPRVSKLRENVNISNKTEECIEKSEDNNSPTETVSVDSSKENNTNSSFECDEKSIELNNSLHNYFNKVEKTADIFLKSNVLKVKAVVHYPPSEEKIKPPKRLKTRLRRRKSLDLRPEYDIITSEEDNGSLQNSLVESASNISVSFGIPDCKSRIEETITSPESSIEIVEISDNLTNNCEIERNSIPLELSKPTPIKIKHDGTLNSFFRMNNRISEFTYMSEERKIARQQFLKSGIPDNIKKVISKKLDIELLEGAPFPKQNHVTQADALSIMWNLKIIEHQLKNIQSDLISMPSWSHIMEQRSEERKVLNKVKNRVSEQKKIIKSLKKEIKDYPVNKWYAEFLKMKNANENEMWTEKYRPRSSLQLLGNSKNVEKLKCWLQGLNSIRKGNVLAGSEDEFQRSDDEEIVITKNLAFLQGPSGIGKTASIYALAEEIGYNILEINCSCNRMGKKILHEFSEALQSHKVEANTINFIGTKKNQVDDSKKSLVLIEDVDVIFPDYDEGFLSTIATLAATSKRPILFTLNEYNPKHLAKIITFMQFKLDFKPLSRDALNCWIRTLAAAEGIQLRENETVELINWANGDCRKLILQLQLLFVKNSKLAHFNHPLETSNVWRRMSSKRFDTKEDVKNTANLCNMFAVCDMLNEYVNNELTDDKPCKNPWQYTLRDSSQLNQPNESTDHPTRNMLGDLIQILKENLSNDTPENENIHYRSEKDMVIPSIERDVISPVSVLSHSSVALDYLPILRSMARTENKRLAAHSKRNNRYFSYLQSIGITENTVEISNILDESFNTVL